MRSINELKKGIRISFIGTGIEAVGMLLDILHHLNIGLETEEGLITGNHLTIFVGFLINFIGVSMTFMANRKRKEESSPTA